LKCVIPFHINIIRFYLFIAFHLIIARVLILFEFIYSFGMIRHDLIF
jgi:hypothetical protein